MKTVVIGWKYLLESNMTQCFVLQAGMTRLRSRLIENRAAWVDPVGGSWVDSKNPWVDLISWVGLYPACLSLLCLQFGNCHLQIIQKYKMIIELFGPF